MRVYTRRTGRGKRINSQPQPQSFVQKVADSIGLLNSPNKGSFPHGNVVKSDSQDSFEQPSLLSLTACSDEDNSVIPYEQDERTSCNNPVGRWVGVGLDGDGLVIDDVPPARNIPSKSSSAAEGGADVQKKEQATEIDAIQALVRALSAQQKKVAKLQAEIKTDAHTKNDLGKQIKVLKEETRSLSSILASSENSNDELKSKLVTLQTEYKMKIDQIARLKDMLILNEKAESSHVVFTDHVSDSDEDVPQCEPSKQQATIYSLSSELKKAKEENEALRAELKAVTAAHERSEKLAESKIAILVEMKNALETQVQLLEAK